jgi:hypothetical protein
MMEIPPKTMEAKMLVDAVPLKPYNCGAKP